MARDGVGEHPPVVVLGWIENPSGHVPGLRRRRSSGIRGVASAAPAGTLAARVHHEVRVARRRPERVLEREPPPTVISLVLDDHRKVVVDASGTRVPGLHGVACETGEGHVPYVDVGQRGLNGRRLRCPSRRASLGHGVGPKRVEIRGLRDDGPILAQLIQGEVVVRHCRSLRVVRSADDLRRECPRQGSNLHWADFKSAASASWATGASSDCCRSD